MTREGIVRMRSRIVYALDGAIQELYECLRECEREETYRLDQEITHRLGKIEKARDDLKALLARTIYQRRFILKRSKREPKT